MAPSAGRAPRLVLLGPPLMLVAVVAIAVIGRVPNPGVGPRPVASAVPLAAVVAAAVEPSPAAPTSSLRSDWPAAIGVRAAPVGLHREEGTDGMMGRLPFGLPNDTPWIRDDPQRGWSRSDSTPPAHRRLDAFTNFRTDPFER